MCRQALLGRSNDAAGGWAASLAHFRVQVNKGCRGHDGGGRHGTYASGARASAVSLVFTGIACTSALFTRAFFTGVAFTGAVFTVAEHANSTCAPFSAPLRTPTPSPAS
jgi:hypothetical protein